MERSIYPHPIFKEEFEKLIQWSPDLEASEGIIVGCDWKMQTMIPWWWKHYRKHNNLPVAFIDFGLSGTMHKYCKTKGRVINLWIPKYLLKNRYPIPNTLKKEISPKELRRLKLERATYFHKPFAMLKTPFKKTVWIDLDCQINGSIAPLFHFCGHEIALTPMSPYKHQNPTQSKKNTEKRVIYNSGVVCYQKGDPTISQWAAESVCRPEWYYGDQDVLNELIWDEKVKVKSVPNRYNWIVKEWGQNPNAEVIHYAGLGRQYDHSSFSSFKIQLSKKPYQW